MLIGKMLSPKTVSDYWTFTHFTSVLGENLMKIKFKKMQLMNWNFWIERKMV